MTILILIVIKLGCSKLYVTVKIFVDNWSFGNKNMCLNLVLFNYVITEFDWSKFASVLKLLYVWNCYSHSFTSSGVGNFFWSAGRFN
jgi:hypothetical protein